MTDNEIIKALECCGDKSLDCTTCPYYDNGQYNCTRGKLFKDAVAAINRQKAEIERLTFELRKVQFDYLPIDALMDEFCSAANYNDYGKITLLHIGDIVDRMRRFQLAKEMVVDPK